MDQTKQETFNEALSRFKLNSVHNVTRLINGNRFNAD